MKIAIFGASGGIGGAVTREALVDELKRPTHPRQRFTVAY
jgi:putative NADH-flavin reductase